MHTWTSWEFSFINSTFTRAAADLTADPLVYDKTRSIYATSGGTLKLINSTFSNYLLTTQGGALELHSVTAEITNCTFSSNSGIYGGVVYSETDVTATFTNCIFDGNKAQTQGGVIFARDNSIITTASCTFRNSEAPEDAVLTILQNSQYNDNESTITLNNALTK
jgi:predicted outer membrane repeat protein